MRANDKETQNPLKDNDMNSQKNQGSTYNSSYKGVLKNEIFQQLRLVIPILIGQLSTSLLGLIDTVMASSLGISDLAAISLGCSFWIPLSLLSIGICLGLSPIVASLLGQNEPEDIPKYAHNALFPLMIITLISMIALLVLPGYLLGLTDLEPEIISKAKSYINLIVLAFPGMSLYHLMKNTAEGVMVAVPTMIIGIVSVILNIPLNYIFMYGKLGIPAMGAVGCGVATAIITWTAFVIILLFCRYSGKLKEFHILGRKEVADFAIIKHIFKIGFPISIALLIENFTYYFFGYATAHLGSSYTAAHQIASIVSVMVFMLPVAVSTAEAIRISNNLAVGSKSKAILSVKASAVIAHAMIIPVGLCIFIFRHRIIDFFTDDPNLHALAAPLFWAILAFQVQDSIFGVGLGILRGFKDTKNLMLINFAILWCASAPLGYLVGFTDFFGRKYGLYGLWGVIVFCYWSLTLAFAVRSIYLFRHHKFRIYRY